MARVKIETEEQTVVLEKAEIGPPGPPGPPAPPSVYVGDEPPTYARPQHIWIQTGLGENGDRFQVWWEDGVS